MEGPTKELICKGCGLSVQPGYPKCPRCKMPLPTVTAPLKATTRPSAQMQGGTAIAEESSNMSLVLGGAVLALVGIGVFLAMKDSGKGKTAQNESSTAPARERPGAAAKASETETQPTPVGIVVDQAEDDQQQARLVALRELEDALASSRLWSSVESPSTDESLVVVQSGSCVDEAMQPAIQAQAALLKGAGFGKVHCVEKHGALVFELEL